MASAALLSLSQTIHLAINHHHQHRNSTQLQHQIISINEYVLFLQDFLENFPEKANNLEPIMTAAARLTEDIIELLLSNTVLEPSGEPPQHRPYLPLMGLGVLEDIFELYMWKDISFPIVSSIEPSKSRQLKAQCESLRCDFHDLTEAMDEIRSIAEMVMKLKSGITVKDEGIRDPMAVNGSSSMAHKDGMVGFENDSMEIKSRLCRESSKLEVIPIVGMGGIGKTTLARNVYDDPLIIDHFQVRVWVTVSQDYSVEEIVSCILISMKVFESRDESMREEQVYQYLKNRKYLVVMDDVWSISAWDDLKLMFPDDGNGSRIVITTRLSDVASYADSASPLHEMHLMDVDLSWKLLQQKVFRSKQCPVGLERSGKEIARSCRGLPLAIVVISGILSSVDHTAAAWENIAENVTTFIHSQGEQFDKILCLSYAHLPHHLRSCFLYMGRFPEDSEVRASRLIKLWIAEGFLKPNECDKSSEETAQECLGDLVKRNLVSVTKRKSDGRVKTLSMHDLMREMCIKIAHKEKFFRKGISSRHGINIPYSSSVITSSLSIHDNIYGLTIRTIILWGGLQEAALIHLLNFRLLRILDLLDASAPPLPAQVFELFQLRYLAFNGYFNIPLGISNLQNLQTLIIYTRTNYEYLQYHSSNSVPFLLEIWSFPQLRHLVIQSGFRFCLPPQGESSFCLENLQTLSLVMNFICTEEILKTIPNLKKLEITYSECVDDEQDYQLHNLQHLQQLENLKLRIHRGFPLNKAIGIVLPETLRKLCLIEVTAPWEDMDIVGSLPNLEVLKLRDYACDGQTWETKEGGFPQLKFLLIDKSFLRDWIAESSHFPNLVCLVLHRCWDLREIPDGIGEVPTLEMIEVDDEDLYESAKQIQEDQRSYGNEGLQVLLV